MQIWGNWHISIPVCWMGQSKTLSAISCLNPGSHTLWLYAHLCMHMCVYTCAFSTCTAISMFASVGLLSHRPECAEPGIKAAAYSAQAESTGRLLREGRGATRSGRGQSAANFSPDRKRAGKKKKKPFQWRMTGPSVRRSGAQEFEWQRYYWQAESRWPH